MSNPLINRKQTKVFLLDYASRNRHHTFTRVSPDILDAAEANLRKFLRNQVEMQPSKGQTIKAQFQVETGTARLQLMAALKRLKLNQALARLMREMGDWLNQLVEEEREFYG